MANQQITQAAARALNLPDGFKTYSPFPFGGINLQTSGIAIGDQEFTYVENFFKLGDGYLRTAWDIGPSIFSTTFENPIVSFFFYTIGSTYYVAVFMQNGIGYQVKVADKTVTLIELLGVADGSGAPPPRPPAGVDPVGFFFDVTTGQLPGCSQWGTQYLLICNRNTRNDYWAWDGNLLYTAGTAAPNGVVLNATGAGYTSSPTVTLEDGHGQLFSATANVLGGQVVSVTINNPGIGFRPTDMPQLIFTGGGSDNGAYLQAHLRKDTVASIDVVAPGRGYTTAPAITFAHGGGGSGAAATATVSNGQVVSITVTSPGHGYTLSPDVIIGGPGTGAIAIAYLDASSLLNIRVIQGGSGYRYPPPLTIVGGGGSGATAAAILTGTSVDSVQLTSGGTGYTSAPTVTFVGGGGSGATVSGVDISNGQIVAIVVGSGGSGYTSQPFLSISGGGGSGATALVILKGTSIDHVDISSNGTDYTSAPTVLIGGGANDAAGATVNLMPFGISGSCIETFQQRVWIANPAPPKFPGASAPPGGNFAVSAPGTLFDFAISHGAFFQTNTDSFLQTHYEGIRQSNGYLYFFGDGSVSVVSNVNTSGSPVSTTFNYQNVDLQTGLSWRDSRQDFGRSMLFADETGIYGLYGGSVTKVGDKLNKLFDAGIFPVTPDPREPSAAIAHIHEVKHYFLLMEIIDPDTNLPRRVMATWNEKDWVVTTQTAKVIYIGPQKVESKFTAWGTDALNLFPLFNTPSSSLIKRLDTKLYGTDSLFLIKDFQGLYMACQDLSGGGINIQVVMSASGLAAQNPAFGSVPSGTYAGNQILYQNPTWSNDGSAQPPFWPLWGAGTGGVPFCTLGARMSSSSPDFAIGNIALGYTVTAALK